MTTFFRPALAGAALRTLAWTFTIILILAACDGNGSPTAPTGGIRGTYSGSWILRATEVNTGTSFEFPCPGSVTINNESATTLDGSWSLNTAPDCDPGSGTFQGTRSDGEITVVLDPDPFDIFEDQVEECTVLTRDDDFSGFVAGGNVSFDGSLTADCDTAQGVLRLRLTLLFVGTRPS